MSGIGLNPYYITIPGAKRAKEVPRSNPKAFMTAPNESYVDRPILILTLPNLFLSFGVVY